MQKLSGQEAGFARRLARLKLVAAAFSRQARSRAGMRHYPVVAGSIVATAGPGVAADAVFAVLLVDYSVASVVRLVVDNVAFAALRAAFAARLVVDSVASVALHIVAAAVSVALRAVAVAVSAALLAPSAALLAAAVASHLGQVQKNPLGQTGRRLQRCPFHRTALLDQMVPQDQTARATQTCHSHRRLGDYSMPPSLRLEANRNVVGEGVGVGGDEDEDDGVLLCLLYLLYRPMGSCRSMARHSPEEQEEQAAPWLQEYAVAEGGYRGEAEAEARGERECFDLSGLPFVPFSSLFYAASSPCALPSSYHVAPFSGPCVPFSDSS